MSATSGEFISASAKEPCPKCGAKKWCSIHADRCGVNCRHDQEGAVKTRHDKNGTAFFVHRWGERHNNGKPRANHRNGSPAAVVKPDFDEWHDVNSSLLKLLKLSPTHRINLRTRGLSDNEIDAREYRSLYFAGRERFAHKLQEQFPAETLLSVPGFRQNQNKKGENILTLGGAAGMFIPCRDVRGRIIALKVRSDSTNDKDRYSYVSSKKHGGNGPGSPVHCPLQTPPACPRVRVTEGELKADVATVLNDMPTISIAGVAVWKPAMAVLVELRAEIVRLAFDADAWTNSEVCRHLLAFAKALKAEDVAVELERWPANQGKGIDDLLATGGTPEVLSGDDAFHAIQTAAEELGVADTADADDVPKRLREVLNGGGAIALFSDKKLLESLATLAVADPPAYGVCRAVIRDSEVKISDFNRAIKRIITEVLKDQPAEFVRGETGGFFESDDRICRTKLTADGPTTIPLCNFTAVVVDETIRDDGVERQTMIGMQGKLAIGRALPRVEVSAGQFADVKWIVSEWGTDAIVWPGENRALPAAIQALSADKQRKTTYTHTGWRELPGGWHYLHAGGAIGAKGNSNGTGVDLPPQLAGFCFPNPPTGDKLRSAVKASLQLLNLAPLSLTFSLFAAIPRSVISTADFGIHLCGPSGVLRANWLHSASNILAQNSMRGTFQEVGRPRRIHWRGWRLQRRIPCSSSMTSRREARRATCSVYTAMPIDCFAVKETRAAGAE